MVISFVDEDGRKVDAGMGNPTAGSVSTPTIPSDPEKLRFAQLERLQDIIDRSMKGELPRDRALRSTEPDKLNSVHIQMIMDRASGMSINEIADKYEYQASYVSVLLGHPDSQTVLSTILSMTADRLIDVGERLKHLAPEALNVKVEVMRLSKNDALRDKVAGDILALAGYGGKAATNININSNNRATLQLPEKAAVSLVEALKEASLASKMDYSQYLSRTTSDEIIAEHKQLSNSLPGQGNPEGGASPSPSLLPESVDYEIAPWDQVKKDARDMEEALEDEKESRKEKIA